MDWGNACSLGCLSDLSRYFLLVMNKGTKYFVSFTTKNRASQLALLKQLVTLEDLNLVPIVTGGFRTFCY